MNTSLGEPPEGGQASLHAVEVGQHIQTSQRHVTGTKAFLGPFRR
jgi:hypothetical protein